MTISEKVAYLKGMYDGMALEETSKEAKLIGGILDVLEEVGLSIGDLEDTCQAMDEELDAISEDLADVEELVYDEEEDDDEDEDFFEIECPSCGADICIDEEVLEAGEVTCPACGEGFAVDLSDEECDCCKEQE